MAWRIPFLVAHVHRHAAALPVQEHLHPAEAALELADPGNGADRVEPIGGDIFEVLALGDGKDELVRGGEGCFDGAEGAGTTGADRRGDSGEEDDIPQGEDRQCQAFTHSDSLMAEAMMTATAR